MLEGGPEPQASSAQVNGELPRGSCREPVVPSPDHGRSSQHGTSGMADLDS